MAASVPPELRATSADTDDDPFAAAVLDTLAPAPAEVLRQALRLMAE